MMEIVHLVVANETSGENYVAIMRGEAGQVNLSSTTDTAWHSCSPTCALKKFTLCTRKRLTRYSIMNNLSSMQLKIISFLME